MLPWNSLDCRKRNFRDKRLSPIQAGILPCNLFILRSKNIKSVHFFKDKGSRPEKLLLRKFNVRSIDSDPKDLGILPEKLLWAKSRNANPSKGIKQLGRFPDNRFSERSREISSGPAILHIAEVGPENILLERSKAIVCKGKVGNGPSNWLELKSTPTISAYFDDK
jgi:hypothetical protein